MSSTDSDAAGPAADENGREPSDAHADADPDTDADTEARTIEDGEPEMPELGPDPPSVDDPAERIPDPGTSGSVADADPETVATFWRLVLVVDVALLALSLGPLLVYFRGDWRRGLLLTGLGLVCVAYGVVRYRRYRRNRSDSASEEPVSATGGGDDRNG